MEEICLTKGSIIAPTSLTGILFLLSTSNWTPGFAEVTNIRKASFFDAIPAEAGIQDDPKKEIPVQTIMAPFVEIFEIFFFLPPHP